MIKNKNKFIFYLILILVVYGVYCAVTIGKNWDSFFFINIGKERLSYLLSFGQRALDEHYVAKMYPGIYNTLSAFFDSAKPITNDARAFAAFGFFSVANFGTMMLLREKMPPGLISLSGLMIGMACSSLLKRAYDNNKFGVTKKNKSIVIVPLHKRK